VSSRFKFDFENFGWGGDWYRAHGVMMPGRPRCLALLTRMRSCSARPATRIFPDHICCKGLRLKICQGFDRYITCSRPASLPGIDGPLKRYTPEQHFWVIVRSEKNSGLSSGVGGRVPRTTIEAATDFCRY
jgi:tartrate dehydrogenase/decarboxylase/D-malate dehydrogenase